MFKTSTTKVINDILLSLLLFVAFTQRLADYIPNYNLLDDILFFCLFLFSFVVCGGGFDKSNNIKLLYVVFVFLVLSLCNSLFISFAHGFVIKTYLSKLFIYSKFIFLVWYIVSSKYQLIKVSRKNLLDLTLFACSIGIVEQLVYIKLGVVLDDSALYKIRNNLIRVKGMTGHQIEFGLMCLAGFLCSLNYKFRFRYLYLALFFLGVYFSGSRFPLLICIISIMVTFSNLIMRREYYWTLVILFFISSAVYVVDGDLIQLIAGSEEDTIRFYSIIKVITYAIDNFNNIILGTGIGTFGTSISATGNSWVYREMNFSYMFFNIVYDSMSGIESFVSMLLIEVGIVGLCGYLYIMLNLSKRTTCPKEVFWVFLSISLLMPVVSYPFFILFPFLFSKAIKDK